MTQFSDALPQLSREVFLTDSGLETELIYNQGVDLQQFAAFPLLDDAEGMRRLRSYFAGHAAVAARADVGFVLESVTWRANSDWGALLGYDTPWTGSTGRRSTCWWRYVLNGPRPTGRIRSAAASDHATTATHPAC